MGVGNLRRNVERHGVGAPVEGLVAATRHQGETHVARSAGNERAVAVAAALAPYAWRELTDRMLARRAVGAADRQQVVCFLAGVPGTDDGAMDAVEPAEVGDERVAVLMWALDGRLWRGWSLPGLCAYLISTLETWAAERASLESHLRRLLEDR
jgi:hypothetical protein